MPTPTNQFRLKLAPSTVYKFFIDWGDNSGLDTYDIITSSDEDNAGITHTYPSPGFYIISIFPSGVDVATFPRIYFNGITNTSSNNDDVKVERILEWGKNLWTSMEDAFEGCVNLSSIAPITEYSQLSGVRNFSRAWNQCERLPIFPIVNFTNALEFNETWRRNFTLVDFPLTNFPKATSFSFTWNNCQSLTSFNAINFPEGIDFSGAWSSCTSLTTFPAINCPKGTSFSQTWINVYNLRTFPNVSFPEGLNFFGAWSQCVNLTGFPSLNFPKATSLGGNRGAWQDCSSLLSFPSINCPVATNFTNAWSNCINLRNFSAINCPEATSFSSAWANCVSLSSFEFNSNMFSKMTDGLNAFVNVTLPAQTWSSILTSICASNINNSVSFNGGNSKYNPVGETAKNILLDKGWSVTDGGLSFFDSSLSSTPRINNPYSFVDISPDGRYMLASTNTVGISSIVVSRDYGITWAHKSANASSSYATPHISNDGNYIVAVGKVSPGNGIVRSANGGDSWSAVTSPQIASAIHYVSESGQYSVVTFDAAVNHFPLRFSSDYSATFPTQYNPPIPSGIYSIVNMAGSRSGNFICFTAHINTSQQGFLSAIKTTNYGTSFTLLTSFLGYDSTGESDWVNPSSTSIACSENGQYITMNNFFNSNGLLVSNNSGTTWTRLYQNRSFGKIVMSETGQYQTSWVINGKLWYSVDYGATFTEANSVSANWLKVVMSRSGKYQAAITTTTSTLCSLYVSSDYGASWSTRITPSRWYDIAMSDNAMTAVAAVSAPPSSAPNFVYILQN